MYVLWLFRQSCLVDKCRIHFLRHMKTFFNLVYKVEGTTVEVGSLEQLQVSVSCLGVGFSNYAKAMV